MSNNAYKWAYRYLVDSIYCQVKLDKYNVTYENTKALIDGGKITMNYAEFNAINNLRLAWKMMLNDTLKGINFLSVEYFTKVNSCVGRDMSESVGSIKSKDVHVKLQELSNLSDPIEQAVELILYFCKIVVFDIANLDTSFIIANAILIKNDVGILLIKEKQFDKFEELKYNNDTTDLKKFLMSECIDFQPEYKRNV